MSAADDLTELVERAAAAEQAALAAKWKPRADVDAVRRKVRRVLVREISDYASNAEARAFAEETARSASTVPQAAGASVRKPPG